MVRRFFFFLSGSALAGELIQGNTVGIVHHCRSGGTDCLNVSEDCRGEVVAKLLRSSVFWQRYVRPLTLYTYHASFV